MFAADILAEAGAVLCFAAFLAAAFGGRSGWLPARAGGFLRITAAVTVFAAFEAMLLRLTDGRRVSLACSAVVCGAMFYLSCCGIPAAVLF